MILNASLLASARPPEMTRVALCRSGRSPPAASSDTKRVCAGSAASGAADSIAAFPPLAAASKEAVRIVATIRVPAATSTVTSALPA
jgi:hypothetical protein